MEIKKVLNDKELNVELIGRLDTITSRDLEQVVEGELEGITSLVYDFKGLEYVSSAGLRVLLKSQKTMNKQGEMVIKNASDSVKEIFDITGFSEIFTLQ